MSICGSSSCGKASHGHAPKDNLFCDSLGIGLRFWEGEFEQKEDTWLRWEDENGELFLLGTERVELAEDRAEAAEDRTALLEAKLRELGIDPNEVE